MVLLDFNLQKMVRQSVYGLVFLERGVDIFTLYTKGKGWCEKRKKKKKKSSDTNKKTQTCQKKSIRISTFLVFLLVGFVAMATFNNFGPFSYTSPGALWSIYFIVNGSMFLIYTISQIILVTYTLDDRWPLGDIAFGILFFVSGLFVMYIFSVALCEQVKHYLDGLFLGSMCNLLSVMMVYKYWDSITKEDLEFSIDSKHQTWEIQALLKDEENKIANKF